MRVGRQGRKATLLITAVLLWGCGSSAPSPSSPEVANAAAATTSPALPARTAFASPMPAPTPSDPRDQFLDQVVVTVSDRVRVRSEPRVSDDSTKYETVLPIGTELMVLDGPVTASGYTWYKVAPVSFDGLEGPGFGWVAMAGTDGEKWIALPGEPVASAQAGLPAKLEWQRVPTSIVGGSSRGLKFRSLSIAPGMLIAVGGDVQGAVVLRSSDGVQWTRAADEPAFDDASLRAIASRGGQVVAVGARSGSARGLLWTTTDGVAWRDRGYAFAGNIEVVGVAAGPSSFVVAGSFRTPADASGARRLMGAAWTSADAATWDRFTMPVDTETGDFRLTYVTFVGSRFVALGRASDIDAHPGMLVWTSTDGRAWRRGQDIPVGRDGSIDDIALGPGGALIAAGRTTADPSRAAVFTSSDGLRWTHVPDGPDLAGAVMRALACDEQHCLAVGESASSSPSNAAAWTSADGVTWSRTGQTSALGDVGMVDVALIGDRAVAIGWATAPFESVTYVDRAAFWTTLPVTFPTPVVPAAIPTIRGHWETLPSMTTPRIYPVAAVGKDGRIYVFGGKTRPAGSSVTIHASSVEIFDPATNSWSFGPPIPGPGRNRVAAVTAMDGRIFLFHKSSRAVLVYDPARSAWTTGPALPSGTYVNGAIAGPGPLLSVVMPKGPDRWLYTLDPVTERWRSRGATGAIPIALGADGLLYGVTDTRMFAIDPATGQTTPGSAGPELTAFVSAAAGPDHLIWTIGAAYFHPSGIRWAEWSRPVAQAYDPSTDSWFVAPPPTVLRWWHAVVPSGNRLYVIGGSTGTYSAAVEAFVRD